MNRNEIDKTLRDILSMARNHDTAIQVIFLALIGALAAEDRINLDTFEQLLRRGEREAYQGRPLPAGALNLINSVSEIAKAMPRKS